MDFEKVLSGYKSKACILSVEVFPDGNYGNIRIVDGNKAHYDDMENTLHHPFVPDSPYAEYFPQNNNFEDFCYRAAILGQPEHAYVPLPQMGLWLSMILLPLNSDQDNVGYCLYSYEVSPSENADKRADISADISSAVLKTCIKLRGATDTRKVFNEVIEDIRQMCDSDYCCMLLTDKETRSYTTLCEAIRPDSGLLPMDEYLDDHFRDIVDTWDDTLSHSTSIIIKDERDMEWLKSVNPIWHKSIVDTGVKTIVLLPLVHNGVTLGYTWTTNFKVDDTVKIKETLELTSFFLASEIANLMLVQRLEIMGSIDALTGVKNRNIMNVTVDEIINGKQELDLPFAVIFADLNGLKTVNDENGHVSGDRIIKAAASILRESFSDSDVFRAGGDEFMIIAAGMDEEEVKKRTDKVKALTSEVEDLSLAIGSYVTHDSMDIIKAMRLADQGMYADKKAYYETHSDRRSKL